MSRLTRGAADSLVGFASSLAADAQAVRQPMIAYALLPLVVSGALVIRYLAMGDPSLSSKLVVVAILAASLIVWWKFPTLLVVAVILEVGVSLFVLIYLRVNPYAS